MAAKKEQILNKLFSLHRFGIKPGLERTRELLESCGNPEKAFPSVHVAGTNGKGSVCAMIASVLTEAGFKTGLYTSPHIEKFKERIRIDGVPISDEYIVSLAEMLFFVSDKISGTFFEITTVMAFKYFAENNVDIAIVETGLGGRFDSTNVLEPMLEIITPIGLDHTKYLGNDIASIAFEKAGIIKPNSKVLIADTNQQIKYVFDKAIKKNNAEAIRLKKNISATIASYNADLSMNVDLNAKGWSIKNLRCELAGEHQLHNLKTAYAAIKELEKEYTGLELHLAAGISNIVRNTGFRARIELIGTNPPVVADVAHDPTALGFLVDTLNKCGYHGMQWNIVFTAMNDKDAENMLKTLKPICGKLLITKPATDRALECFDVAYLAKEAGIKEIEIIEKVPEATVAAVESGKLTIITGSFYLLGEAMPVAERILNYS